MMMTPPRRDFRTQRFKGDFNRAALLELSGMSVEAFDSLRRRGQIPWQPTLNSLLLSQPGVPTPDDIPEYDAQGWSPFMALALILANDLVEQYDVSRDLAAHIARHIYLVGQRWPEIRDGSKQLAELRFAIDVAPAYRLPAHIVLARVTDAPGQKPTRAKGKLDPTVMVGTMEEIAAKHPKASGMIAVSVTAAVAQMRKRAAGARLDLSTFFNDPRTAGL